MEFQVFESIQLPAQRKRDNSKVFPVIYKPCKSSNFVQLQEYFEKYSKQILCHLDEEGALFFRGFDIRNPN